MTYDSAPDILAHRDLVFEWLTYFTEVLFDRAVHHDDSKLVEPEKSMYDRVTPLLQSLKFGTPEYEAARAQMGEGLAHHYANNDHHPEWSKDGVAGMTLFALVEMFCDWLAACEGRHKPLDLDYLAERFQLAPQLVSILRNTVVAVDASGESTNRFSKE